MIEKSPPNMMRLERLSSLFRYCSFLANNRDPYANCASRLYRHYDAHALGKNQRIRILRRLAKQWVVRSDRIKSLVKILEIPLVRYEDFCEDPEVLLSALRLPDGVAEQINFNARLKIKDYKPQRIKNMNARQVNRLRKKELDALSSIFEVHEGLLDFFDYGLHRTNT